MTDVGRRLLGQILKSRGVIREGQIQEALAEQNPDVPDFQSALATLYDNLATTEKDLGQTDEAVSLYEKAIEITEALAEQNPDVPGFQSTIGYA